MKAVIAFAFIFITSTSNGGRFPFKQFFRFGTEEKMIEEERKSDFLCGYGESWTTLCDCDKDCMKYQTCCIDYMWDETSNISLSTYISQFVSETRKYKKLKCTPIVSGLTSESLHTTANLLMVAHCPRGTDNKLKSKCKQNKLDLELLPVIGVGDELIYKNKYCASCNLVRKYKILKVRADCRERNPQNESSVGETRHSLEEYSACKIYLADDPEQENIAKKCNKKVINKCVYRNRKLPIITTTKHGCRLCRFYNAGVSSNTKCCKNPHCCPGEFHNGTELTGHPDICYSVFPQSVDEEILTRTGFSQLPKYSILLTFKDVEELRADSEESSFCFPGEFLDPISNECVAEVMCPFGQTRVGSNCVQEAPKDVFVRRDDATDDYQKNCLGNYVYIIVTVANPDTKEKLIRHLNGSMDPDSHEVVYENETSLIMKVLETNYLNVSNHIKKRFEYQIVKTSVPAVYHNELYGMDFSRSFNGPRICVSPVFHKTNEYNVSSNCFVTVNSKILYVNDYVLYTVTKTKTRQFLVTCKQFHLSTPCLLRSIKNYTILPNSSLQTGVNTTYKPDEYQPMTVGVGVCVQPNENPNMWLEIVNAVEGYITVIGCVFSIIAYCWIIATYSIIAELRTTPGKNIICLCAMLMACDILMLCMIPSLGCKYIAILLHFFALSAQFWAVVTAFDIWSTFQGKSLSRNLKSKKRFACYCLFGWVTPLVFVLLSITLDETKVAEVGYGKYGICWITDLRARIVTYIMPVGLMIIFTVGILVYTMNRIYRQCNKSKLLLKKRGGDNVSLARMALKLVILLGAIEIFGFLQFPRDNKIDWIFNSIFKLIYSIVRSFRGVFIWLFYVVTDRVFKIYRNIHEQRSYRLSSTKLTSMGTTSTRTFSTRSSDNFNTTLTIAPTPTPL